MLWDVRDTGLQPLAGSGVRASQSNIALDFHTDNASNLFCPEYVGLLALQVAKAGGENRFVNIRTIYNCLSLYYPQSLTRLYQPFYFDRMGEHKKDEEQTLYKPVFEEKNGQLETRLNAHFIRRGYQLRGEPMDEWALAALAVLEEITSDSSLWVEYKMQKGQVQYVNNCTIAHARTEYADEPLKRRHFKRIWMRKRGLSTYEGG